MKYANISPSPCLLIFFPEIFHWKIVVLSFFKLLEWSKFLDCILAQGFMVSVVIINEEVRYFNSLFLPTSYPNPNWGDFSRSAQRIFWWNPHMREWQSVCYTCGQSGSNSTLVKYGQGSLSCCSPWGHKQQDTTEQLNWIEPILWTGN